MQRKKWNVALFDLEPWEVGFFRSHLPASRYNLALYKRPLEKSDVAKLRDTNILSVFITSPVPKTVIEALPHLGLVTTRSTGFDHVDLVACARHKVKVANVPHYGENTVAEHAFGLILALSRNIHLSYDRTARADFSREGLRGFDLKGKTLGVIGCGSIGKHVIRIAQGFEMTTLVFDPVQTAAAVKALGSRKVSLTELLRKSDVVTLHAPLTPKTRHLINKQNVKKFKKGAMLINTARGGLVDTEALLLALERGWIAQAGLDVLEEEESVMSEESELLTAGFNHKRMRTVIEDHILMHRNDVLITPHNAFNSLEAVERILATTVENIEEFARGKASNLVGK